MPTVFINGTAVVLATRFTAGQPMSPTGAALLNAIWQKRVAVRLRRLLTLGQIDKNGIPAKIAAFAAEELTPYSIAQDADDNDPVLEEAREVAKAILLHELAKANTPPPRSLDGHIQALIEGMPGIIEQARLRVEARYKAVSDLLAPGAT